MPVSRPDFSGTRSGQESRIELSLVIDHSTYKIETARDRQTRNREANLVNL